MRILMISTYPPMKCGLATFTKDLYESFKLAGHSDVGILAMCDEDPLLYPAEVVSTLKIQNQKGYIQQANWINANYDVCIIQHEYGIFGGASGNYILDLAKNLQIPLISHLHTILPSPSPIEKEILAELMKYSQQITVMTPHALDLLKEIYQIPAYKIALIPHGVPTFNFDQENAKIKLGLQNKKVMLSFGFLGRNKGIETALKAISAIEDSSLKYIVLGATHPNVIKHEGEIYRQTLIDLCKQLNIEDKVDFINEFVSEETLKDYLTACDIYVSPYPSENQISSGTLSFALGAGAAVISTPYLYAKDLLADDRGMLFDFENHTQLSQIISKLLNDNNLLEYYRDNAKRFGIPLQWPNVGKQYLNILKQLYHQPKRLWN
ncbi:MAG: glycosyltransferase [Pedobacter sp.]|nr:MAG: glycosyltransferase [Pedobacter sp.]